MSLSAASLGEIECLAELVRRQHPKLATIQLEPDGRYQTRRLTLDGVMGEVIACLSAGFRQLAPQDFPELYCAWGKARVGSTALNNLFGVAGLLSYYQPVKAVLRHALTGGARTPWILPSPSTQPQIFCKDLAGPYRLAECLYIPLKLLVEAGYPTDKLHLIMLDRDPATSLTSWLAAWSDRLPEHRLVRNYVVAALNAVRVEAYARRHGVPVTHYVYEVGRNPVRSAGALFARLGLLDRFTEMAVTDWVETGQLDADDRIIYAKEPPAYLVREPEETDTGSRYRGRSVAAVSEAHLKILAASGVQDVYRAAVAACVSDLRFDATTCAKIFGPGTERLGSAA